MPTQQSIQEDAINGVILASAFILIIILFASQNIVLVILSMLSLYAITVTLMTMMVLAEWKLGLTEVLLLVVVMALCVGNTVFLAHDFSTSAQFNRDGKMRQAYLQKGKVLTSTTLMMIIASCFLFGAKITFFENYAIVLLTTLIVSYIMAIVFFGAMAHLFGPSSGCGDICGRVPGQEHEQELEMVRIKQEMQV